MTKLATSIAVLSAVEKGWLSLDTRVGDRLPEYDTLQVLEGFDKGVPRMRRPAGRGTLEHLLTHTSGLGYPPYSALLARYHEVTGTPLLASGLRAAMSMPLLSDPGNAL